VRRLHWVRPVSFDNPADTIMLILIQKSTDRHGMSRNHDKVFRPVWYSSVIKRLVSIGDPLFPHCSLNVVVMQPRSRKPSRLSCSFCWGKYSILRTIKPTTKMTRRHCCAMLVVKKLSLSCVLLVSVFASIVANSFIIMNPSMYPVIYYL
jgi:hypothetical protein